MYSACCFLPPMALCAGYVMGICVAKYLLNVIQCSTLHVKLD